MKHVFQWSLGFLFLIGSAAQAGGYGHSSGPLYMGAGAGATKTGVERNNLSNPNVCNTVASNCTVDDKDKAWQVYGGYRLTPRVALEAGYVDLGRTANVRSRMVGGDLHGKQDTKGVSVSMVGNVPMGGVMGYGRAGVYRWDSEVNVTSGHNTVSSTDGRGTDATLGAGVEMPLGRNVSARVGWDRYYNVGNGNALLRQNGARTLDTDVDVYSASIQYNF